MTHRPEAVLGRHLVTRWRLLAERRLQHLTELRDSGRWRRYYREAGRLAADLGEAERAVAAWRLLAPPEPKAGVEVAASDATAAEALPMVGNEALPTVENIATWRTVLPPVVLLPDNIAVENRLRQA